MLQCGTVKTAGEYTEVYTTSLEEYESGHRHVCSCGWKAEETLDHELVDGTCACGYSILITETVVFADLNLGNETEFTSATIPSGGITISAGKGTGSNAPKYYDNGSALRFYQGNVLTITPATGYRIASITFTATTDGYGIAENAVFTNATVTGKETKTTVAKPDNGANPVTLTSPDGSGQYRFVSIEIAYTVCEHSYGEGVVTAPTCTAAGYTTYTCTECGATKTDNEVAALGHTAAEAVVENKVDATCGADGSYDTVVYCSVCGVEMSREAAVIEATGEHTWNAETGACTVCTTECAHSEEPTIESKDHTCTEDGYSRVICSTCGKLISESIFEAGHTAGDEVTENNVDATCTEDGSYDTVVYCSVCNAEISRVTTTVEATGEHNYVDGTCTGCGEKEVVEHEHAWGEGVVTTEPGKETTGVMTYTCTGCNETKTEEIPPILRFGAFGVTLKSNIQLNYKVKKEAFESYGYTDAYVVFTMLSKDGSTKTVIVTKEEARFETAANGTEYYVFDFSNLAPDMFNHEITGILYAKNAGKDYVSEPITRSIKGYVEDQLTKPATINNTKLRRLMVDMLNYGAALQMYNNYMTESLANAGLTEEQKSWATGGEVTAEKDTRKSENVLEKELITWKATSLELADAVVPNVVFVAEDLTGLVIKVTCAGTTREYDCAEAMEEGLLIVDESKYENGYRFYFRDLGVTRMRDKISFIAYDGEEIVSQELIYSVQSYGNGKMTPGGLDANGKPINDLMIAMLKYGDAADAYTNG